MNHRVHAKDGSDTVTVSVLGDVSILKDWNTVQCDSTVEVL